MVEASNKANGSEGGSMVLHYEVDALDGAVYISVQYGQAFQGVVGDGTLYDPFDADGNPVYGWVGGNYYPRPAKKA